MTTVILNTLYLLNYFCLIPHHEAVLDRSFAALQKKMADSIVRQKRCSS